MTYVAIALPIAFWIIYDIWVIWKYGAEQSISWKMYTAAIKYPIIPFAIGVVMGHLFWVQHGG